MGLTTIRTIGHFGWGNIFRLIAQLAKFLKLIARLVKDPRTPAGAKFLVAAILAYVVMPSDLLPDILVGVGQLDDLAIIIGGLKLFLKLCPANVVQEHLIALAAGR